MHITVIGSGYVGLVAGACFADIGNDVTCVDKNQRKIDLLNRGEIPIFEPGLEAIVRRNREGGRLHFTTQEKDAVSRSAVIFIAVGTPPSEDGSADLGYVLSAARSIGSRLSGPTVIVNKSTVPVGTAAKVEAVINEELARRGAEARFAVVSNPEFLKEGTAVEDFMRPDRIVIGGREPWAIDVMRRLYAPLNRNHDKFIVMDANSAELTKYAANAMLATRISFMNEMARLSEAVGADIELVRRGIGSDPRIGHSFLYAGCGYGGSCFPKDVRAVMRTADENGIRMGLIQSVEAANELQKHLLFDKLAAFYEGEAGLAGKTIALWGLSFKPNTDDIREAPSLVLIERLLAAGVRVRAHDPVAMTEAGRMLGARDGLAMCASADEALSGSDALVIVTEWREFRSPDFAAIASKLRDKAIFDGRNLFDRSEASAAGLSYFDIGRNPVRPRGS